MRIIRFLDDRGRIRYGRNYENGAAELLEGDLFSGLKQTGDHCSVKKLLSPVVPPAVFGIGLNYHKHAQETGMEPPTYPVLFMKNPAAVTNPGDPILPADPAAFRMDAAVPRNFCGV